VRRALALAAFLSSVAAAAGGAATPAVEEFVARHWRAPLAPQGAPPARFSATEASLAPEACGTCHPAQLADWRTSVHAQSMGPGVAGQLVEMLDNAPGDALACQTCHAPLAEQRPLVRERGGHVKNPVYDPALSSRGLVCAGCHVRAHERFGPPRRDGSVAPLGPRETLPHNGVTRTSAFLASEFCRGCHQFTSNGFALNGKLLENTYEEWKASRFAREGVQCQDCHMPDRRHLWRGIHDPEMVRSGLKVTARGGERRVRAGDLVDASLAVESTRVGHAFPTYVTPRVVLRGELIDAAGDVVAGTRRERVIAREVALDLSREIRDTRLSPGGRARLDYRVRAPAPGLRVRLSVVVEPDAFYTAFFEVLLENGAGRGEAQIREALAASRRSVFTVFVQELPAT
jgi:hypothetical protein